MPQNQYSTQPKAERMNVVAGGPTIAIGLNQRFGITMTARSVEHPYEQVSMNTFSTTLYYKPEYMSLQSCTLCKGFTNINVGKTLSVSCRPAAADRLQIDIVSNGALFNVCGEIFQLVFVVTKTSPNPVSIAFADAKVGYTENGAYKAYGAVFTPATVNFAHTAPAAPKPSPRPTPAPAANGVGPSGNNISMESVGSIAQAYTADRLAPTASITGRGYNLLTAHVWSAKDMPRGAIIDFTGLSGAISQTLIGAQDFTVTTESSMSKLSKKFSEKASVSCGFGLFKASFSESYESTSSVSEDKAYSKIWYEYIGMREEITTDEWKRHLNPAFWKDLNNSAISPQTLFERYGTHLIVRGLYGGHMDLLGTTYKKVADSTTKIEASLSASIGSKAATAAKVNGFSLDDILTACNKLGIIPNININAGGGQQGQQQNNQGGGDKGGGDKGGNSLFSASFETSYEESSSRTTDKLSLEGHMVGGIGQVPKTLDEFTTVANSWIGTLKSQDTWRFCGVPKGSDSLYPIWKLAPSAARQKQLSDYYESEMLKNQNSLVDVESYVTDIKLVWDKYDNAAKAKAYEWERAGYKFDSDKKHDLNKGVGDNSGYLYIGYLRETKAQMKANGHRPITNLFIYCDDKDHKGWYYDRYDSWKRDHGAEVKLNGCTNINFSFIGDRWNGKDGYTADKNISNLSHGKVTKGRFLLLCYTKDSRFTPLTALGVYNENCEDEDEYKAYHATREWIDIPERGRCTMTGVRCKTTAGTDGNGVYLVFKRAEEKFSL